MRAGLLVAVLLLVSGCASTTPPPEGTTTPVTMGFVEGLVEDVPALDLDIPAEVAWWAEFSSTYVKRDTYLPNNLLAEEAIVLRLSELAANGVTVTTRHYAPGVPLIGCPPAVGCLPLAQPPASIEVIEAVKPGTSGRAIVIGSHYDTQAATLEGAFDNGSGTAMGISLCRALAAVPMNHTLVCAFFDGEELGLLGSNAYANDPSAAGYYQNTHVMVDFDMVGLNWPGYTTWKFYCWTGEEHGFAYSPMMNETVHGLLHVPDEGFEASPSNPRSSDELSYEGLSVPILRWSSGRASGDYEQYHLPGDTVAYVDEFAGGRANFEAGYAAVLEAAYYSTLVADRTTEAQLLAQYTGAVTSNPA